MNCSKSMFATHGENEHNYEIW